MRHVLGQLGVKGVRVGRIAGIRITLDWTWFIIAALFFFNFTGWFAEAGVGTALALGGGLGCALGFFGSILAHELGHALTARRFGIHTESIALHVFGGVARLLGEPRTPRQEFLVAAAGPAVSLGLAGLFGLLATALPDSSPHGLLVMDAIFGYLALANLVLGVFNLLPGFPLDGGRVLRAIMWARHGSWRSGTHIAARVGEGLGAGLMGLALLLFFLTGSPGSTLMLGGVGFLVRQAARAERLRVEMGGDHPNFMRPRAPSGSGQPQPGTREQVVRLPDGRIVVIRERV